MDEKKALTKNEKKDDLELAIVALAKKLEEFLPKDLARIIAEYGVFDWAWKLKDMGPSLESLMKEGETHEEAVLVHEHKISEIQASEFPSVFRSFPGSVVVWLDKYPYSFPLVVPKQDYERFFATANVETLIHLLRVINKNVKDPAFQIKKVLDIVCGNERFLHQIFPNLDAVRALRDTSFSQAVNIVMRAICQDESHFKTVIPTYRSLERILWSLTPETAGVVIEAFLKHNPREISALVLSHDFQNPLHVPPDCADLLIEHFLADSKEFFRGIHSLHQLEYMLGRCAPDQENRTLTAFVENRECFLHVMSEVKNLKHFVTDHPAYKEKAFAVVFEGLEIFLKHVGVLHDLVKEFPERKGEFMEFVLARPACFYGLIQRELNLAFLMGDYPPGADRAFELVLKDDECFARVFYNLSDLRYFQQSFPAYAEKVLDALFSSHLDQFVRLVPDLDSLLKFLVIFKESKNKIILHVLDHPDLFKKIFPNKSVQEKFAKKFPEYADLMREAAKKVALESEDKGATKSFWQSPATMLPPPKDRGQEAAVLKEDGKEGSAKEPKEEDEGACLLM